MILYRPVGLEELVLIYGAKLRRFPPRLPEQPYFYPVLGLEYADQIARRWNTTSGTGAGYVLEFEIDDEYGSSWPVRQAGARWHLELWIPAESLEDFNSHICGQVRLVRAYFGPGFSGLIPSRFSLKGMSAREQLLALRSIHGYSLMDFHGEITGNSEVVFAHYPFWEQAPPEVSALRAEDIKVLLDAIQRVWATAFHDIPLGVQAPSPPPLTDGH